MLKKIAVVALIGAVSILPFVMNAYAETKTVTLKYVIPQVTTFSVSFPTGLTDIEFQPSGATFTNEPAYQQSASTAAMRITNTGNVAIKIDANLTTDLPTNVTEFRLNTANDYNGGWYWTDANETTTQTIIDSLAIGADEDFWAWSAGSNVPAGTYTSTQLQLVSSAV